MCNNFTFARTYMSAHTYMSTYRQEYFFNAQDCVGKSVPAAVTAATYFVVCW